MNSYEVHGVRVSSTEAWPPWPRATWPEPSACWGRPYTISGHVVHGRKLGRKLAESAPGLGDGFNLEFAL